MSNVNMDYLEILMDSHLSIVSLALAEDLGSGDCSALLIDEHTQATAHILTKEAAILCGVAYAQAVLQQMTLN